MAGVGAEVKLAGFERLGRKLGQLGDIDFGEVLEHIGATVTEQTLERFEQERDPEGRPWRPLQAKTVLRKRARSKLSAMKILQESSWQGGLISTIHHQVGDGEVVIGANKVYAAIHQFGGAEAGKPGIPARPFLGLSAENEREVEEVIEDWFAGKLKP